MHLSPKALLCASVACICLAGCSEDKTAAPVAVRSARVVAVALHKHSFVAQGAGRIQSRYVSQVGFEVGGRLTSREVYVGAVVKKGQKLAQLSADAFLYWHGQRGVSAERICATFDALVDRVLAPG